MSVKTFRKKPVEVQAMQLDGTLKSAEAVLAWADPLTHGRTFAVPGKGTDRWTVVIETLEGAIAAGPGDWVIKSAQGEFHSCRPDVFAETYDEVSS